MPRAFLAAIPILLQAFTGWALPRDQLLIVAELQARENTFDGCTACGCRSTGDLTPERNLRQWASFGLIESDSQGGWKVLDGSSHCGKGSFKSVSSSFRQSLGIPYVTGDLVTNAVLDSDGTLQLTIQSRVRKFSGFDEKGEAVYRDDLSERLASFSGSGTITLPLLIPDGAEKELWGIHEVLLHLRVTALEPGPSASYGAVSVTADVPGSTILLDGGFVGRISDGGPTRVENVLSGTRTVVVRDLSSREAIREVSVETNRTATANFRLLPDLESGTNLLPVGRNPQGYEEYWRTRDGALVVKIPEGEFLMGSPGGKGEDPEHPQHRVSVSEFLIDKTEVTWRQFKKFVEATRTSLPQTPVWGTPDDYPASFVDWEQANRYCQWVGGRLPTEAEWEKAARGQDGRLYPWGDTWVHDRCNSRDGGPRQVLAAGGSPDCLSPFGVLDMAGNVWEWCHDRYLEGYYAQASTQDPKGPDSGSERVLRGGAWVSPSYWLRTSFRYKGSPTYQNANYGFRCVQEIKEIP